ncbi:MAG TPA: heavy-metal-associated domain-containing protein [Croceibacterium sp.]|nr:heavy-metal-associated domain-containing protein [Croceibacterium sp.]
MSSLAQTVPFRLRTLRPATMVAAALFVLALAGSMVLAQVEGDRGIMPVATSSDIDVYGLKVDVGGKNSEEARERGWQLAMRLGWKKLGGPDMPDSRIESMVSAVVVEHEQVGPNRYIAQLGVIFDRQRAGALLGAGGEHARSAPMLVIPVLRQGGVRTVFETRNPWQRAWAERQFGASAIDYVRPQGAGGESLLLTAGQPGRRSRAWWRNVLDTFGAADVLTPIAILQRDWPGGPVRGRFVARYGPDNTFLDTFALSAQSDEEVPAMLDKALGQFDQIYTAALASGKLQPDPTLRAEQIEVSPVIKALLEAARTAELGLAGGVGTSGIAPNATASDSPQVLYSHVVQFATPDAAAVDAMLGAVRATPGVRGAATSSIAIGGTSVMRVTYGGDIGALAVALRGRGFTVQQGSNALSISR